MNIHKNARLTPIGRERLVGLVESGQTPETAARRAGVCPRTVRKWLARFRAEGVAGLQDRSSRPHRLHRPNFVQTSLREWAYLTGAFCVAATGAWYLLRGDFQSEARIMLRMGLYLAAVLIPAQLFFGHLVGEFVHDYQPAKFAAIEGRWRDEQPASEVLIAIPDAASETNRFALSVPVLGSLIASMSLTSKEIGLTDFPPQDRPPVLVPFFAFRIMVGCGVVMLLLAWIGTYLSVRGRIEQNRPLLWCVFLSFPLPYVAILTGWFAAEVGRQPWTIYGVLRTSEALTPFLTTREAAISLVVFCSVYLFIFSFGVLYIYRLLCAGPVGSLALPPKAAIPSRPMSVLDQAVLPSSPDFAPGE
jgi:cytochrome bd ubiquinol oxidase subunit I